jgi:hypothetical protein
VKIGKQKYFSLMFLTTFLFSTMSAPSFAVDYSCLQSPDTMGTDPDWKTSSAKDLKFVVSWAFKDPENCIVGIDPSWDYKFRFPKDLFGGNYYEFPATWKVSRDGEMALVSAETEFPIPLLQALNRIDNTDSEYYFSQLGKPLKIDARLRLKRADGYITQSISGEYGFPQIWGHWLSKNQGIYPDKCMPDGNSTIKADWKILESGVKPRLEISLRQENNCIFLIHSGPLESFKVKGFVYPVWLTQAEYPFWSAPGSVYFKNIISKPNERIQIGLGDFMEKGNWDLKSIATGSRKFNDDGSESYLRKLTVARLPGQMLGHDDSVVRENNVVKIKTTIDGSKLDSASTDVVTVLLGIYAWYESPPGYSPSGWNITFSGNSWTARYSKGGSTPPGTMMSFENIAIKIPIADLLLSAEAKAAAALKAKQEAEAKAAAALKAKQEADAKAAVELKAKQEAEAKAAAPEVARLAQQKQYCLQHNIDVQNLIQRMITLNKDPNLLNSKVPDFDCDIYGNGNYWSKASIFSETKKIWETNMSLDLKSLANYEKEALSVKKTTITCIKGKSTKKVTAVKPKCPAGYKQK